MQKKIFSIIGARPQFIKAAAVSRVLRTRYNEILVHTGQHFDKNMSEIFFKELEIPAPDYNLGISGSTHGRMTAQMMEKIEELLLKIQPDLVLLYGDTNSTLAGALTASKLHIPIAHVEAGPRTYDKRQPEEVNRVITDHLSSINFCPTLQSVKNLKTENIINNVFHVGDVIYDSSLFAFNKAQTSSHILKKLGLSNKEYILATIHRAEHTNDPKVLSDIVTYLRSQPKVVVWPIHPRTKQAVTKWNISLEGLVICEPIGYIDFTWLTANAAYIITDSGGLPKEAYFHRVPCITIGDYTPWPETIKAGWNRLWTQDDWKNPRQDIRDYGSGKASHLILQHIINFFK
ncbi:UDP-N-acetylglucosamine 2-epimerase [endosymbiont of Acanthamoeba sp. UWC8]|uniref:non-hydrolyzing UDP-N-acetylglucosamine 2-epimerase n=1 Tax=endosymbiont of Acanthamoeba sp. UWC8 TaxID=86106 RepID=UPI0004D1554E|nr:UDP-N-acetylglucosamine 2-epimerase (non-hydrolyzing) [endosymbiont of Acanthamoeba sp. UWC8]AIF82020.1 UDP-N-acetylglucosamine 2-epimerase [endosymbiont of Acanthamoeba sp. UWC8]